MLRNDMLRRKIFPLFTFIAIFLTPLSIFDVLLDSYSPKDVLCLYRREPSPFVLAMMERAIRREGSGRSPFVSLFKVAFQKSCHELMTVHPAGERYQSKASRTVKFAAVK